MSELTNFNDTFSKIANKKGVLEEEPLLVTGTNIILENISETYLGLPS
jgi:hypothetical protein